MAPDTRDPPLQYSPPGPQGPHPRIPLATFLAEAERLKDTALRLLQADGHHAPILILFTGTASAVVGLRHRGDRPMHEVVTAIVRAHHAEAFVCISEAWLVAGPEAARTLAAGIPPSQHPDRREVLAISAIHPEGRRGWFIPFRTQAGRAVLGTPVDSTGMTLGGGIPEALDTDEPTKGGTA
jgi:hypothetical protein